jgi:hypothetical protein
VALGKVSSKYFNFHRQFSFHQVLNIHLSYGARTINQLVADVPSGLGVTQTHETYKYDDMIQL